MLPGLARAAAQRTHKQVTAADLGGFTVWVSAVIADQGVGEHNLGSKPSPTSRLRHGCETEGLTTRSDAIRARSLG
ncbi:hypothetical protein D5R93_12670 [Actinomyces lilanjuaniae]|uniref:Transposase n=1 Tax=Actinomyces lilanjuaniae TaxID=2321394 RepID=A0ABM6Z5M8_9ACTO|nr:hypothetical protein [Actinomyces lilanjuaniae]AYD90638.1 hypothetical protein D5R93_12670 [Actinomyces lilanjuaniae]